MAIIREREEGSPSAISIYDLIISDICQASIVEIILVIFSLKIYKYCDTVTMIDQSYLSRHVCQHGRGVYRQVSDPFVFINL